MKNLNIFLLFANILCGLAFFAHTIGGDQEIQQLIPTDESRPTFKLYQIWVMTRCGWHWISLDLLFATIILTLINFTNYFYHTKSILQFLLIYFFGYGIVWFLIIYISKTFINNYFKLGQWILLLFIGVLIYKGQKKMDHDKL